MMNWDNWWSVEYSAGPSCDLKYRQELERYYCALREMNYNVDIISPEDELSAYKVVIAPVFYMVRGKEDENIRSFVKNGGTFITTYFSGYVQENDLVTLGGYPGKLRDILGIWVEEEDALPSDAANGFIYKGKEYPAYLLCDLLHLEGAEQIDESGYQTDFYKGMPVITRNRLGEGQAYYIAAASNTNFCKAFLKDIAEEQNIEPVLEVPEGVEVTSRKNENGIFVFIMNHSAQEQVIAVPKNCINIINGAEISKGNMLLPSKDVRILQMD